MVIDFRAACAPLTLVNITWAATGLGNAMASVFTHIDGQRFSQSHSELMLPRSFYLGGNFQFGPKLFAVFFLSAFGRVMVCSMTDHILQCRLREKGLKFPKTERSFPISKPRVPRDGINCLILIWSSPWRWFGQFLLEVHLIKDCFLIDKLDFTNYWNLIWSIIWSSFHP